MGSGLSTVPESAPHATLPKYDKHAHRSHSAGGTATLMDAQCRDEYVKQSQDLEQCFIIVPFWVVALLSGVAFERMEFELVELYLLRMLRKEMMTICLLFQPRSVLSTPRPPSWSTRHSRHSL